MAHMLGISESVAKLNDGRLMPLLGLGTWQNTEPGSVQDTIETAIAAGYRHFDTAFYYMNEAEIGKAIKAQIQKGVVKREDLFIVTKLWLTFHSPEDVPVGFNKSLEALQLDYVDLYLIHFPVALQRQGDELYPKKDEKLMFSDTDYVDTWKAMESLVSSGRVKSIGVSNFNISQLQRLLSVAKIPPAVNQVELHPYLVQSDLVKFCKVKNIALTAYSPFGSPGKPKEYHRGADDPGKLLEDPVVNDIARKHQRTPAQVLLRFHIEQGIVVIPKSSSPERILENTKVFDFSLDEDDMKALKSLDRDWRWDSNDEVKSHQFYPF
ncbi:1,5-anhydro-D-fructose reductase isoform X1 [Amia ocellicauda]|uniref:1,5-anhydro-D-fructose reductase isoform X1 n=1 Tax=Amia ocellicauda TaxID=2972642 RepID=UPI003464AF2F|nr:AKCL2 reductase [Amia calva]